MTQYREILRLKSLGFSERNVAHSCSVSRNTVARGVNRAAEINLSWPLDHNLTDSALEEMLFPKTKSATNKRMPDYDYIRRELLRNGVNKKLLWVEYCEECRVNYEEPLMYSQFCYYIQKDEEKRRATMYIPRKPGEQIEVDWGGNPAQLIDPDNSGGSQNSGSNGSKTAASGSKAVKTGDSMFLIAGSVVAMAMAAAVIVLRKRSIL
jgi:hypothetical protein